MDDRERPTLAATEVHLWLVPLDWPGPVTERLRASLDDLERARADRFRFPEHRDRWTAARAALRDILSRYLSTPPSSLRFDAGPHGKPRLAPPHADGPRFNASRSGALALVALASGREVGVDLEELRPVADAERVAAHFFTPAEREALNAAPPESRDAAFLRCWTRKEAALKRSGVGLMRPLEEVEIAPGEVEEVDVGPGYLAALAVEGGAAVIRRFTWAPPD